MTAADWLTAAATFGVGVLAGILSALLGIGGAVVTTPAVRLLGATPIQAVGSTVPAILPSAISGSIRYARAGLVDWQVALGAGSAGAVFALLGAGTSALVGGRVLMVLTAALMLWSGISVVRGGRTGARDAPDDELSVRSGLRDDGDRLENQGGENHGGENHGGGNPGGAGNRGGSARAGSGGARSWWLLAVVGAGSGFLAGLLGVGGGIVMVPAMAGPLGVPMKKAVASSLVAVAIFSIPALIAHAALGHINWTYALPLMLGVVPGAQIGARITIGIDERTVRRLFGALVVVLAVVYGATEITALVRS